MKDNKVVEIKDIKKYFPLRSIGKKNAKYVKAVDGISLDVYEGETLGLVGESGSGKTTLAKMILGLLPPTESTVIIDGKDIWADKKNRGGGKEVSAVFQDPASSLNPRSTIYRTLERPLLINGYSKEEARERILDTVEKVNLRKELLDRFPNELSGGQQQRVSSGHDGSTQSSDHNAGSHGGQHLHSQRGDGAYLSQGIAQEGTGQHTVYSAVDAHCHQNTAGNDTAGLCDSFILCREQSLVEILTDDFIGDHRQRDGRHCCKTEKPMRKMGLCTIRPINVVRGTPMKMTISWITSVRATPHMPEKAV